MSDQFVTLFQNHFDKVELDLGKVEAVCRHCGHKFKVTRGAGYGNLKLHITRKHPDKMQI